MSCERRVHPDIRRAIADYIGSEGCSCCRGGDHDEHEAVLAKLLRVPKYVDGSGYDWRRFETKPTRAPEDGQA